eukprot:CAMPEP_0184857652 /NCGR_PEP_ID=MMETSP0580-20130426/2804_1 /TAXON_ID=1118495 /ORGANISM="Dactyliosolen fragilissimus" /LENGTH=339 /DNA_ID=CAMNT_0027353367 /DNA_START=109 /DNA_END=1128 /DNA_ORIENTATION=+
MGQSITTTQWFLQGRKHFRQPGYLKHIEKYADPVQSRSNICRGCEGADGVDLNGKTIVVTGANSGIGKEVATYVAAKGAKVYMLCRSEARAKAAQEEIIEQTLNNSVHVLLADVGELNQVRKAASELQSLEEKVDCIVCNAGVLLNEKHVTSDGYESTFASHLLGGSFLLSKLLIPQLKNAGSEAKVIFVTSGGMLLTNFPSWDKATCTDPKIKYDGVNAYSYAKRGQVILAERLAKESPDITFVSAHPGWCATAAVDDAFGESKKYLEPMRNTWQGAEGLTWLISTKKQNLSNGSFYLDRTEQRKHLPGLFRCETSSTKNSEEEIEEFMNKMKAACNL